MSLCGVRSRYEGGGGGEGEEWERREREGKGGGGGVGGRRTGIPVSRGAQHWERGKQGSGLLQFYIQNGMGRARADSVIIHADPSQKKCDWANLQNCYNKPQHSNLADKLHGSDCLQTGNLPNL